MSKRTFSLLLAAVTTLCSCQKEVSGDVVSGSDKNPLIGTWKLVSDHITGSSQVDINDGTEDVKTITLSDYTTLSNQGTVTFSDSIISVNGVGYEISTTARAYTYEDGNLADSTELPFAFTVPPASYTASYRRVGTDSIASMGILGGDAPVSGSNSTPVVTGYHYRITGDDLELTAIVHQSSSDNSQGVPINSVYDGKSVALLKRQ